MKTSLFHRRSPSGFAVHLARPTRSIHGFLINLWNLRNLWTFAGSAYTAHRAVATTDHCSLIRSNLVGRAILRTPLPRARQQRRAREWRALPFLTVSAPA